MTKAILTKDQLHKSEVFRLKWKQVLDESVKDRPAMPEALGLKLVQSLVNDGIPYDAKIGVVDSTPILALHLKEAGFTNLVSLNNSQAKYSKPSERLWLDDVKGFCTNNKIKTQEFSPGMATKSKFDVIIGNPPYGNGGSLAIKFLNLCLKMSNDVRLILPRSVRKDSMLNRISLDAVCVYDELLPSDTFVPATSNTKAVIQHWTPGKRQKVKMVHSHPDLQWTTSDKADLKIRRIGTNAGGVHLDFRSKGSLDPNNNHFIKVTSNQVAKNLKSIEDELKAIATDANNQESIGKHEIISTYIKHFG